MSNVETAIEGMIQNTIDENDFITRADVEQYYEEQDFVCRLDAEQYTDDQIAGLEDQIAELVNQFEELESRTTSIELVKDGEPLMAPEAPASVEQEPRAVNQIDWIMTPTNIISGYDSKVLLLSYIRSVLHPTQSHQAEMVVGMVLATARNLINNKLESE